MNNYITSFFLCLFAFPIAAHAKNDSPQWEANEEEANKHIQESLGWLRTKYNIAEGIICVLWLPYLVKGGTYLWNNVMWNKEMALDWAQSQINHLKVTYDATMFADQQNISAHTLSKQLSMIAKPLNISYARF